MGILAGFLSTFWNFGYTRTGLKMQQFLDGAPAPKIKKQNVVDMVTKGMYGTLCHCLGGKIGEHVLACANKHATYGSDKQPKGSDMALLCSC